MQSFEGNVFKSKENVLNKQFNVLALNIWNVFQFISLVRIIKSCLTFEINSVFNIKPLNINIIVMFYLVFENVK